jgi:hypothetical protein
MLVVLFHLGNIIALPKYFDTRIFDTLFSAGDAGVEFCVFRWPCTASPMPCALDNSYRPIAAPGAV